MTPEIKAKLEAMAPPITAMEVVLRYKMASLDKHAYEALATVKKHQFMTGAQAGYALGVKAERERINAVFTKLAYESKRDCPSWLKLAIIQILNPTGDV